MLSAIEQGPDAIKPDTVPDSSIAPFVSYPDYKVIRRNGAVVAFEPSKVSIAMTKAFLAISGVRGRPLPGFANWSRNLRSRSLGHWCAVRLRAASSTLRISRIRSSLP